MASHANQSSGSGDTNKKKKVKAKPRTRPANVPAPGTGNNATYNREGTFQWNGTGHHSISQADHEMHVADPLTKDPLYASAKQQATAFYAPQTNALDTQINNAPTWYQNYMNTARGAGTASAAYAQPVINNARTFATNINTPATGLDPNSPEYQKSVQAGKGISALAEFGAQNLEGNQAADQTYFQGQATNAAATLPGVLAYYQTQKGQLGSQIQGKTQELYQGLHAQAVNEDIARKTLGLNISKAAGVDPITGKPLPADPKTGYGAGAPGMNKYGYTYDEWNALSPADQAEARAGAPKTGKTQEQKDAAKHATSIKAATGKAKVKVQDIMDAWARGGTVPTEVEDTSQPPNLLTGERPKIKGSRKMTRAELEKALGSKYGSTWVSIMKYVRAGTPITQAQIDYLHSTDPDLRIPKEWIKGKSKSSTPAQNKNPHGTSQTPEKAPGGAHGHY